MTLQSFFRDENGIAGGSLNPSLAALCDDLDRQMRKPYQSIIIGPLQLAGDLKAREAFEQLLVHYADFKAGEIRTETEVSAKTKADVIIRITADIEAERLGKLVFVAIG